MFQSKKVEDFEGIKTTFHLLSEFSKIASPRSPLGVFSKLAGCTFSNSYSKDLNDGFYQCCVDSRNVCTTILQVSAVKYF